MLPFIRLSILIVVTLLAHGSLAAENFPTKPIHLIVPFPPGAGTDALARAIGMHLAEALGQPVFVDNRPGAGGTIGSNLVAKAAPDGYTLLLSTTSHAINPSVYAHLPYDTLKDFATVTEVASAPTVLLVHQSIPVTNLAELIDFAKANPGRLNMSSSGSGTIFHLAGELLKTLAGIDFVHVPYSGGGPAMNALISGQVSMLFETTVTALAQLKTDRIRAIAAGSEKRIPSLPDLPTIAESGFKDFSATNWYGMYVPAKTPKEIVTKLNAEIVKVLNMQAMKDNFSAQGVELIGSTPEQHEQFLKAEMAKWSRVAKQSNVKAD